ncbi:MAG: hypothetical protein E7618_04265 [Ruminococcaceae bacterium]|nr:hypothetical protein [Oscillospiraceae bacterium]
MLTYVINTSENRTLDSDRLFDLAGYNKIRWMNASLNEMDQCAQFIFEKQNVLGADEFRIAIIVDFYGFDRIRVPYRRLGYKAETGVDISLYLPFIETYLVDHLLTFLENRELSAVDFEIYYVQNTKLERYEFIDNALDQMRQVLNGGMIPTDFTPPPPPPEEEPVPMPTSKRRRRKVETDEDSEQADKQPIVLPEDQIYYSTFELYCTPSITLSFSLSDYPYGYEAMTFPQFFKAFHARTNSGMGVRRHYYISHYGGGQARAAFDTLTLSLHLIRMYEREETPPDSDILEISRIDAEMLKDVLVSSWNKICLARDLAKANSTTYFSLKDNVHIDLEALKPKEHAGIEVLSDLNAQNADDLTPEELFRKISYYYDRTPEQLAADNRAEFDRLMNEYLRRRDETTELDVESELADRMLDGSLVTTQQFPSKEEYLHIVARKQEEISVCFDRVLTAGYREVDYTPEKIVADKAYEDYRKVKACMHRSILGDLLFFLLALLASVGPYAVLQLRSFSISKTAALLLAMETTGLFAVLFILAVLIQISVLSVKLTRAKRDLRQAYTDCYQKECDSLVQIRQRYEEDLIFIERSRYEIRQLKYLYEANLTKDANVKRHRELLEELEDRLGSMLNHLDVEPIFDPSDGVTDEFDLSKPIRARENKVYRVFSLETIERLFAKKGRE